MRNFSAAILTATLALFAAAAVTAQTESYGDEFGLATYYHDNLAGSKTASGETYNPRAMTAGHMRHEFNTMLKVTRLDNNKSVTVRVNDRGPFVSGRVVELSRAAAEQLGMINDGLAEVKLEVVKSPKPAKAEKTASPETGKAASSTPVPASYETTSPTTAPETVKRETAPKQAPAATTAQAKKESSKAKPQLVGKEYQKYGLYKISIEKPGGKGFAVQVASLENYENVFQQVADLQAKWFDNILISIEKGKDVPVYKILLGPFESEPAAANYLKNLQKKHKIKGFVVDLSATAY